jgi:hypothetical protein
LLIGIELLLGDRSRFRQLRLRLLHGGLEGPRINLK